MDKIFQPSRDGWYCRGYLPHYNPEHHLQSVTFRFSDSLPVSALERMSHEQADLPFGNLCYRRRLESLMDQGLGACWFRSPEYAELMREVLLNRHGEDYELHAWVIMPNHVHVLYRPAPGRTLATVVGSWKAIVAHRLNKMAGRTGGLWEREYWDRYVRDAAHYARIVEYIHANPVRAVLAALAQDWSWSSAREWVEAR